MTNYIDFDALARKTVESNGATEDLNNLWNAVFALAEWHFIARGELPNISPYIAANAAYADGKQMIRAFTDTNRLQRFAAENNLTEADGSAPILSLPTVKIIDYLEKFIPYGVHGIWFNCDTGSDGFFLPLAQLRPVKEYLAKINRQPPVSVSTETTVERKPAFETLIITVKDGLALPSGFVSQASYACNFFCRVPAVWIEGGKLKTDLLEKIYEQVYGQNWRAGNSDGSRYVILDSYTKVFTPDEISATNWSTTQNTNDNHFWFYIADQTGEIKNVTPEEFQADIGASPSTETKTADVAPPIQSSAGEDYPLADAPGGETDLILAYYRKGEVSFDASIAPFQEKIAPLLEKYKGAGEYRDLLSFDADAMEGLTENTVNNAHGAYLRARRFFHQPGSGTIVAVQTLDSSALRQTETNAALRINFALLKNLVNQTAILHFRFEGAKSEVLDLSNAVKPVLESCGFKESPGN